MTPDIHVLDDTYIDAPVDVVLSALMQIDEAVGVALRGSEVRQGVGMRWQMRSGAQIHGRGVKGEVEVWCEPWRQGTVVHHIQRLFLVETAPDGWLRRRSRNQSRRWKRHIHVTKDALEREKPAVAGRVRTTGGWDDACPATARSPQGFKATSN